VSIPPHLEILRPGPTQATGNQLGTTPTSDHLWALANLNLHDFPALSPARYRCSWRWRPRTQKPPTAMASVFFFFFFFSRQTRKQYNDHKQLKQSIEKHQNENFLQKRHTSFPPSLRQPRRHAHLVIYLVSGLRRLANAPEQISTSGSPQWAYILED
jgi:hypothetical protein